MSGFYSYDNPATWDANNNPYVLTTHAYTAEDVTQERNVSALKTRIAELEKQLAKTN